MVKFGILNNSSMMNMMMIIILYILDPKYPFMEKKWSQIIKFVGSFSFELFDLIMPSFCFGKLLKIPENPSAMQSFVLTKNTE